MAAMTVMSIPAALFIFDEHLRYRFYLAPARALHKSALADQHAAGMIMLFAGGVAMALLAILVSMEAMLREERRQLRRDAHLYPDGDGPPTCGGCRREAGGRMRRAILTLTAIVCLGLSLFDFAAHAEDQGVTSSAATSSAPPPNKASVARGHELFLSSCAACHGMNAQGIRGRAPSLHGVGALAADFYLETGRMPLPSPRAQPMRTHPAFSQAKIQSLIDYVASFGGPAIPTVDVGARVAREGTEPVCAPLRRLSLDPGVGRDHHRRRRSLAECRDTPSDRRGDSHRALRDAAVRAG